MSALPTPDHSPRLACRRTVGCVIALVAIGCAASNLWIAAARSLIPLRVQGIVIGAIVHKAKRLGVDDVNVIYLFGGESLSVDRAVLDLVRPEQWIDKRAWQRELRVEGELRPLGLSSDFRGMVVAMPVVLSAMVLNGLVGGWPLRRRKAG